MATEPKPSQGFFASLLGTIESVLALARTRFELLTVELQEEKVRLIDLLLRLAAAAILALLALGTLTAGLIWLLWPVSPIAAFVGLTLLYGGGSAWLLIGMVPPPGLNATDLVGSAEVVAVAVLACPPALTGLLTGVAAGRLRTMALLIDRPGIGSEELTATAALASDRRAAHRARHFGAARPGRKRKRTTQRTPDRKKEEELYAEEQEENPAEENGISNRLLSSTFIPSLTTTCDMQ